MDTIGVTGNGVKKTHKLLIRRTKNSAGAHNNEVQRMDVANADHGQCDY